MVTKNRQGSATIIALVFMLLFTIAGGAWVMMLTQQNAVAHGDEREQQALYAAQAGLRRAKMELKAAETEDVDASANKNWQWLNEDSDSSKWSNYYRVANGVATTSEDEPKYGVHIHYTNNEDKIINLGGGNPGTPMSYLGGETVYSISSVGVYKDVRKVLQEKVTVNIPKPGRWETLIAENQDLIERVQASTEKKPSGVTEWRSQDYLWRWLNTDTASATLGPGPEMVLPEELQEMFYDYGMTLKAVTLRPGIDTGDYYWRPLHVLVNGQWTSEIWFVSPYTTATNNTQNERLAYALIWNHRLYYPSANTVEPLVTEITPASTSSYVINYTAYDSIESFFATLENDKVFSYVRDISF